jgi:homoserine dehydrogenase
MSAPAVTAVRRASHRAPTAARPITIALLGLGCIGSAVARGARRAPHPLRIVGALVRDASPARAARAGIELTTDAARLFAARPDVVVEVLGGIEPARTLVRAALERRIPVVTANKALIAHHGDELFDIAARTRTPLRYEASVLAGVPFLGTFAGRPLASRASRLTGILNGTSNFILSRVARAGESIATAINEAQQRGFAEPDPSDDISGRDAVHKLAVLAWHFGFGIVSPGAIETTGITGIRASDVGAARDLGGTIKPVACIESEGGGAAAFVGPAFVPAAHPLASIDGVENALVLDTESGRLVFSGPGAGPLPTATTILDDVIEAVRGSRTHPLPRRRGDVRVSASSSEWLLHLAGDRVPGAPQCAQILASHGVGIGRSLSQERDRWILTEPSEPDRIDAALRACSASVPCDASAIRALAQ